MAFKPFTKKTAAAYEAKDEAADRKAGVKENSKRDMAMDRKGMPAFLAGKKAGRKKAGRKG